MTRPHSNNNNNNNNNNRNEGWRFALMPPWVSRHIGGSRQGHPRHTNAGEGRPWVAHNTIRNATNAEDQKTETTVCNNVHGSGAQPGSSSELNKLSNADKKLTDSLWTVTRNSDREHKETRLALGTTQIKSEEFIYKIQNEIVQIVENEQCPVQNPRNTSSTQWKGPTPSTRREKPVG